MKVHLKEQFRQFVLPETTSMCPLPNKVTTKRAPKKDKQSIRLTRRSPFLWETVDSQEQETQGSQTKSTGTSRKSARKSNMSPTPSKPIPKNLKKPTPVEVLIPHKDQIKFECMALLKRLQMYPAMAIVGSEQLQSYVT
jgi:hypothetical protein